MDERRNIGTKIIAWINILLGPWFFFEYLFNNYTSEYTEFRCFGFGPLGPLSYTMFHFGRWGRNLVWLLPFILFFSGIGILKSKKWGKQLLLVYSSCVLFMLAVFIMMPAFYDEMARVVTFKLFLNSIYAVICIYYFNRPKVKEIFK